MSKMTIDELRNSIADLVSEAKKKKETTKTQPHVEAYGFHADEHDFSFPMANHSNGEGVNWGPGGTSTGDNSMMQTNAGGPNTGAQLKNMKESQELALRRLVREVIQNGLIDEQSAWSPFISKEPIFESIWDEAVYQMNEGWWDKKEQEAEKEAGGGKASGFEKFDPADPVQKHGFPEKKKKKKVGQ